MSVLVNHSSFDVNTADEAWDVVGRLYTQVRPRPHDANTSLAAASWNTPGLAVDILTMPAAARAAAEPHDQLMLAWWLNGHIGLDFRHVDTLVCGPEDCFLAVPETPYTFDFDTLDALTVRLPLPVMDQAAHELTGLGLGALRFTSARPLSPRHARTWKQTAAVARAVVCAPHDQSLISNPLVHRELIHTVAAAALSVFPNTAMTRGYVPGPGDLRPAAVRRALAYIDAHASLPITVTDVAEAAGTDPRGLRAAFRRHLDTTPTAYLRRARLDGAHRDLQAADPAQGTTVADIAARWGFARLDRFTAAYTAAYGHSPAWTLG